MNNTTATTNATGIEDAEDEDAIILSAGTHTALTAIIGTALPMGLLLELLLIVKLLRKEERRIWDVLMLALEGRKAAEVRDSVVDIWDSEQNPRAFKIIGLCNISCQYRVSRLLVAWVGLTGL